MRTVAALLVMLCLTVGGRADAAEPARFVVFFQEWSAALDADAQSVVNNAAQAAKAGGTVRVSGFADPTGSRKANVLMSDLRAQVVADQLQADGVAAQRIKQRGHGSVQFAMSSQESRRVEITVGK